MAITRKQLTDQVHRQVGCSRTEAAEAVRTVIETMMAALVDGEQLKLHNFGVFTPKDTKARTGRNPRTGETIEISARRVVRFRASRALRDRLNG